MPLEEDQVLISRQGGHTYPQHERVFIIDRSNGSFSTCQGTTNPKLATRTTREAAQKLIDRGRWHSLDPKIEESA